MQGFLVDGEWLDRRAFRIEPPADVRWFDSIPNDKPALIIPDAGHIDAIRGAWPAIVDFVTRRGETAR